MKEVEYRYFINGEEVSREFINWEHSTGFSIHGNDVHIDFDQEDLPIIYDWSEGETEEQKEEDLKTLCNTLSLVGMGAIPGVGLDYRARPLANLEQPESKAINASDYEIKDSSLVINTDIPIGMGTTVPSEKLHIKTGVKHNNHKAPLDIVQTRQFPKALQLIALATAFGNKKYEATDKDFLNFKRVSGGSQAYFDAAARHNAVRNDVDKESGLPHGIHAVWNMLAALEMAIEEEEVNVEDFSKLYLENLHMSK